MQWVMREHPIGLFLSRVRHQAFAKTLRRKHETSCSDFFSSIKFHLTYSTKIFAIALNDVSIVMFRKPIRIGLRWQVKIRMRARQQTTHFSTSISSNGSRRRWRWRRIILKNNSRRSRIYNLIEHLTSGGRCSTIHDWIAVATLLELVNQKNESDYPICSSINLWMWWVGEKKTNYWAHRNNKQQMRWAKYLSSSSARQREREISLVKTIIFHSIRATRIPPRIAFIPA